MALVLRLAALGLTFRGNDAVVYHDDAKIALNIIDGRGFSINYDYRNHLLYEGLLDTAVLENPVIDGTRPTALKQPVYALLLAALFYLFGAKNFLVVFVLHALLSSLTVSLLYLSVRKISSVTALIAALGTATYPPFVGYPVTVPESTTLLLFLIVALLFCLVQLGERPSYVSWGLAGVVTGLTILTDPITIPFVGFCLAYAVYLDGSALQKRMNGLVIAGAIVVAMLTPWLIRNYIVFNEFPLMKTGAFGHVFVWGLKYSGHGSWLSDDQIVALEKAGRDLNELQEEQAIQREVMAQFPNQWRDFVTSYIPQNVFNLWWDIRDYQNDYSVRYMVLRRIPFILLLGFALPHVVVTLKRLLQQLRSTLTEWPLEVAGLVLMINYTVVYGVFGAFHSRYRLPIELVLIVFSAATLARLFAMRNPAKEPLVSAATVS